MIGRDAVIGAAGLAASLVMLAIAQGLPTPALVPIGPGFYPRIIFGVTAVLSALLLLTGIRSGPRTPGKPTSYRLVLLTFGIFIAYLIAMPLIGYRLATLLFVGTLQPALDPPTRASRWALLVLIAVVTAFGSFYVFEGYLSVLLPRGRLTGF
jgi:hypothetical protein